MGGEQKVLNAAKQAFADEDYQWSAELCELLLQASVLLAEAKQQKAQCLWQLGKMETSANGRHYYLMSAKELMK